MGYSYTETRYRVNGLLATEDTVLDNLEKLCNAAGAWLTYDIHDGKWSVIINKSGTSSYSFDDSNIIGAISINGTGLDSLYNKVTVTFPHEDLRDQKDVVSIEIPAEDRNANEPDNTLNITYDLVTDPVQAELLGLLELKQSRVDKIISFRTDYSKIAVKAGDLIDITSNVYGFDAKMFRVITVREVDTDEGGIDIEITALEYDANVYDASDLERFTRSDENGIIAIGAITAPDQPTVTIYSNIARPHITATTVTNNGISDAVEFWITYDVPPGVTLDENRTYSLLTTARPTNGNTFASSTTVTVDVDNLSASNFLIKCRAVNGSATSPFSTPSGLIEYAPVQTTDNITDETTVNGSLLTAAGIATLLSELSTFFDEGSGFTFPGSGGAGDGTTFLLLDIQNFNSNATTGGPTSGDGSLFMPVVRIIPPGVPATVEGVDQVSLGQCFVGYGPAARPAGATSTYLDTLTYSPDGILSTANSTINHWPQYYPRKIIQRMGFTPMVNQGLDIHRFGIDLGAYKLYYPDATKLQIEIRGYWQLNDCIYGRQVVAATPPGAGDWQTSTIGTAPIRANAYVFTGAVTGLVNPGANIFLGNTEVGYTFSSQGIGSSANVVVYDYVYPEQLSSNVALASVGQHITTFTYDMTKDYLHAPSFSAYNFATPITSNVKVPVGWTVNKSSNVIVGVAPEANVIVSTIPKTIGTTVVANLGVNPFSGLSTYVKATEFDGNLYAGSELGGGYEGRVAFPAVKRVAMTANVFQHDFVYDQSAYITGIGPTGGTTAGGIGEWWNVHVPINLGPGTLSEIVSDEYIGDGILNLYSNMARINTTSTAFVPIEYLFNGEPDESVYYVPQFWGQLKANANVSPLEPEDFEAYGVISSGQYYDVSGQDDFPYFDSYRAFEFGFFYNDQDAAVNHVVITDLGIDVDSNTGAWVKGTITS